MSKPIVAIDFASRRDSTVIMCLSCYRTDCEHTHNVDAEIQKRLKDALVEPLKPLFTPSPAPIPSTAYHNAPCPPITSERIQEAMTRLRDLRAQWDKEDAENLAGVPMHEPLPPRVPDLCPDDSQEG